MFEVGYPHWQDTPYPVETFVVTHEARPERIEKSARFHFIGDVATAISRAKAAAGDREALIMGGAEIANQTLALDLVEVIQLQLVPVLLGGGALLFDAAPHALVELECTMRVGSPAVTHLRNRILR